ncbi:hypothetical protein I553_6882 [Mycobacterium xenopi 4042]|uniref:Uncharacterized protein n=1 Tax=Mycobacterium xenopi 4042 TaxID=1299334 RepID=X7Z4S1_MYCXE|nr:hypothetical protein I553_6882 [Mycobacterium xenopi 4042]
MCPKIVDLLTITCADDGINLSRALKTVMHRCHRRPGASGDGTGMSSAAQDRWQA